MRQAKRRCSKNGARKGEDVLPRCRFATLQSVEKVICMGLVDDEVNIPVAKYSGVSEENFRHHDNPVVARFSFRSRGNRLYEISLIRCTCHSLEKFSFTHCRPEQSKTKS